MTEGSSKKRCCSAKYIPIFLLVLILLAVFGVVFVVMIRNAKEVACQFLPNEMICPFKEEYSWIHIMNPLVHLENGDGRIPYQLKDDTDVTLQGFNIHVKNKKVSVRKIISDCAEEGEYPIKFINVNNTPLYTNRLQLKVKDFSDEMRMEIVPFTNISDNKDYVQIICTGYLQCGTVVVDLELKITDFGTYNKPMDCSRTNTDGRVLDNYGYSCIAFMGVDMFQRTESLKCKPTVKALENAKSKYLLQTSVDVINSTKSYFILEKGHNEAILWNVNVLELGDIRELQTNLSGVLLPNSNATDARLQLIVTIKGHIAICKVMFRPVTCSDEGSWKLQLKNGDIQHKQLKVDGMSAFIDCPSQKTVSAGGQLELEFRSCIPDGIIAYYVDLYGKTNRSGYIQENKAIEISDQRTDFRGSLDLNELSVTLEMHQVTCADHMKDFKMVLESSGENNSTQFISRANVFGRYEHFSNGGDFIENISRDVSLRIRLGCRPRGLHLNINGSSAVDTYNLTEDRSTGEKIFSKSFSFPNISMLDHGTTLSLHSSFIDDHGSPRNISITQVIHVVPATFCRRKPYGCNYRHPYNDNMMVSCGEDSIAALQNCPGDLVFVNSSCYGECCPKNSRNNCRSP